MSDPWAARLELHKTHAVGRLRQLYGIEVIQEGDTVWLRGEHLDERLDGVLRSLPGAERFVVLPDRQLVPVGARVPKGYLPDGEWTAIAQWMSVRIGPAAFAGQVPTKILLRLVRCGVPKTPNVLQTSLLAWHDYAVCAPRIRLEQLSFAVDDRLQVVVKGTPLPPIRGHRFVETDGIAVQAGWTWSPPVDADVLRQVLKLDSDDLALLHSDGSRDHILAGEFVGATRSAIRMSTGETAK